MSAMNQSPLRVADEARTRLRTQRLEILYGYTATEVAVGTVISALVALSVWGNNTQQILAFWGAAVIIIYAARLGLSRIYRRSLLGRGHRGGWWQAIHLCGASATGAAWGLLDVALAGIVTPYQLSFALLWTCSLSISTLPIYRGALHPVAALAPTALLPPIVSYLFHGSDFFLAAAVMLTVVLIVLIGVAIGVDETLSSYLRLDAENRLLSAQIQGRKSDPHTPESAAKANAVTRGRIESALQRVSDELVAAKRQSQALATTLVRVLPKCPLTGLINYRSFLDILDTEWRRSMRDQKPLSLVMFDFDDVEASDSVYHSAAAAKCLRSVAGLAKASARRAAEIAFRYGQHQFGLLLPAADAAFANRLAEGLRARIEAHRFTHDGRNARADLSVHAGTATMRPSQGRTAQNLIDQANSALAEAKRLGGNRVVCYRETDQSSGDTVAPAAAPLHIEAD